MNVNECIEKNLIKKDESKKSLAKSELDIARKYINSANKNIQTKEYEVAEMLAYNAFFHITRALLYANGYDKRSHYCLFAMATKLWETNSRIKDFISLGNAIRMRRHNIMYSGETQHNEMQNILLKKLRSF